MSDLNLSLWGAGAVIILCVIMYNFWQEYRAKKNVERAFGKNQDDPLMQTASTGSGQDKQRQEPSWQDHSELPELSEKTQPNQQADPLTHKQFEANTSNNLPVDDFIDCIIPLEFDSPVRGDKILAEVQSFRRVGNKPVQFIGIDEHGKRVVLNHSEIYHQIIVGVQLVSRSGALNELEYSELVMKLKQVAENLNAFPEIPDMKHVMDAGRDLYLFVSEHDAQLSFNVQSKGAPWAIHTLLAALEKQGFDARPDGRMVMMDGEGGALFSLSTNAGLADQVTTKITLLLDVPSVAPARGGFNAMIACAKSLALRLGGSLVDDSGMLIDEITLEQIHEQVEVFYSAMQAADIPAGSTRAVRIFS